MVRGASHAAKWVIAVPLMLLAMPIILILNALGLNKRSAGPDYVSGYLEHFLAGTEGEWDWDDFCSVPLKDEYLDSIVVRACAFAPPGELGEAERAELQKLLAEVRTIGAETAA